MKHLIVYANPNPQSFCRKITDTLAEELRNAGKEVVIRDLYAQRFNPILDGADFFMIKKNEIPVDIKEEQDLIQMSSVITFIYPIWWMGPPAMIKGYFDRVFARDFAYSSGSEGLEKGFTGKKSIIINTLGAKVATYEQNGIMEAMKKVIDSSIFEYTGLQMLDHKYYGEIPNIDENEKEKILNEIRELAHTLTKNAVKSQEPIW